MMSAGVKAREEGERKESHLRGSRTGWVHDMTGRTSERKSDERERGCRVRVRSDPGVRATGKIEMREREGKRCMMTREPEKREMEMVAVNEGWCTPESRASERAAKCLF